MNQTDPNFIQCMASFVERITEKSNHIRPDHTMGEEVLADVYLFRDLVNDYHTGRFPMKTMAVWFRIVTALEYFFKHHDDIKDDLAQGLTDDLAILRSVRIDFEAEINAYQVWRRQNGS